MGLEPKFEDQNCSGTSVFCSQIYREHAEADEALALAKAEIREVGKQLDILKTSRLTLEKETQNLRARWNNGIITAPRSGVLGGEHAKTGDWVIAGHPIAEIFSPQTKHIDWALSEKFIRPPKIGDTLYVLHAGRSYRAMIVNILPLSEMRKQPNILRGLIKGFWIKLSPLGIGIICVYLCIANVVSSICSNMNNMLWMTGSASWVKSFNKGYFSYPIGLNLQMRIK